MNFLQFNMQLPVAYIKSGKNRWLASVPLMNDISWRSSSTQRLLCCYPNKNHPCETKGYLLDANPITTYWNIIMKKTNQLVEEKIVKGSASEINSSQ